jgi:hypothetical protein
MLSQPANTAKISSPQRLQPRVTLDAEMGDLFEWVNALAPGVRARELQYLLRLGYAVHIGRVLISAIGSQPSESPHRAASRPKDTGQTMELFGDRPTFDPLVQAQQEDMAFMKNWNLLDICVPPPPT